MASGVVLKIGPDTSWTSPVNREMWITGKKVGDKIFTCEGYTNEPNYQNTILDFQEMCESVSASQ